MYYIPKLLKKIRISSKKNCKLDKTCKICSGSNLINCTIGKYSYIGYNNQIINTNIGNYCSIASDCIIGGGEHPLNFVSTSPVFYNGKNIFRVNLAKHKFESYSHTSIGSDVWIGHGASIKGGITISTGAVIGMGAVVTHDIGPYEVWGGNPAKLIRKRFSDDIIEKLLLSKWWEFNISDIERYSYFFDNPEMLLKNMESI
ncbi:CatB-related O-acetyltransferase [Clostridium perfringens]|nr:CatB-related O-acetyltransferase [Clostridium perfringens]MDK0671359.1 CatB-related O-acetyltransferase [Clostridium perfringens]